MALRLKLVSKPKWQRVQVLLLPDQYRALREQAVRRRVSMGAVIREAVAKELNLLTVEEKLAIVDELGAMNLPVADWHQMKKEILEAQLEPHGFDNAVLKGLPEDS